MTAPAPPPSPAPPTSPTTLATLATLAPASAEAVARYRFTATAGGPTIVRAEGCELIRDDGRRILDGAAGALVSKSATAGARSPKRCRRR